jgi:hypothetical protein
MLGLKGEAQGDRMLPNNALKLTSPPGSRRIGRKRRPCSLTRC